MEVLNDCLHIALLRHRRADRQEAIVFASNRKGERNIRRDPELSEMVKAKSKETTR